MGLVEPRNEKLVESLFLLSIPKAQCIELPITASCARCPEALPLDSCCRQPRTAPDRSVRLRPARCRPEAVEAGYYENHLSRLWDWTRLPGAGLKDTHVSERASKNGAPGMIRTCDLLVRSQTLYPTELRAPDHYYSKRPLFLFRRRRGLSQRPQLDSAIDLGLPLPAVARLVSIVC